MSLSSLVRHYVDQTPNGLAQCSDASARLILAALPVRSALSDADHADAVQAAVIVAACKAADGMPIADAVAYAWTACRNETARDAVLAGRALTDDGETVEPSPMLARSATPSPSARYDWTLSDTLTASLALLAETDPRTVERVDVLAACPPESWTVTDRDGVTRRTDTGLPIVSALVAVGRLSHVTGNRRTVVGDYRRACRAVAEQAETVTAWVSYSHPRHTTWTADGVALADEQAVPSGRPHAAPETEPTASPVVIRYRDTPADAWMPYTETVETVGDDGETVETVETYLRAVSETDVLALTTAVRPYRRTETDRESDRWADALAWSPGPVAKPSRKPSRVGSTGPTVPARLSR